MTAILLSIFMIIVLCLVLSIRYITREHIDPIVLCIGCLVLEFGYYRYSSTALLYPSVSTSIAASISIVVARRLGRSSTATVGSETVTSDENFRKRGPEKQKLIQP